MIESRDVVSQARCLNTILITTKLIRSIFVYRVKLPLQGQVSSRGTKSLGGSIGRMSL